MRVVHFFDWWCVNEMKSNSNTNIDETVSEKELDTLHVENLLFSLY